jgi:hypothetical protein
MSESWTAAGRAVEVDQVQAVHAFEGGGKARWIGEIARDRLDTRREVRACRIARQGAHPMPCCCKLLDQRTTDPTRCACDQDFHILSLRAHLLSIFIVGQV